ncbi:MAG TPA: HAMP domain-containing sensor histidine kinase, partial [Usitatibacter sp.]|nr:HAMP domain-containing sensor histidine kinase [Usitatibacter sp.]
FIPLVPLASQGLRGVLIPMHTRNEYENEILKARKAAEAASTAKDTFISFVSHELRSPLSAIMGWANILSRENVDATHLKRGVEAIERNAKLQLKLVDDMLDHARLASGKLRIDLARIDVRPILDDVLDGIAPTAQARSVSIVREMEPGPMEVRADAERLQQVFWNLLSNAVKFTPAEGLVTVALRRRDNWVEVVIADTGKGITADFLPFVFDRFRQEEGRVIHSEGGLGLGMAITRYLVELHGGTVAAASAGPGQGATFTLRLPVLVTATAPL